MKRKYCSQVIGEITIDYVKKDRLITEKYPSSFIDKDAVLLDSWVTKVIQAVMEGSSVDTSRMEVDDEKRLNFLVFLGAQGKEYINDIKQMFPLHFEGPLFLSLNIDRRITLDPSIHCADMEKCKQLAAYFNILDPLGGGAYPLNYLIVTDSDLIVRCKLPIRIGQFYGPHQKFGVSLDQLKGLIDEYLDFFMKHHITITF